MAEACCGCGRSALCDDVSPANLFIFVRVSLTVTVDPQLEIPTTSYTLLSASRLITKSTILLLYPYKSDLTVEYNRFPEGRMDTDRIH